MQNITTILKWCAAIIIVFFLFKALAKFAFIVFLIVGSIYLMLRGNGGEK